MLQKLLAQQPPTQSSMQQQYSQVHYIHIFFVIHCTAITSFIKNRF